MKITLKELEKKTKFNKQTLRLNESRLWANDVPLICDYLKKNPYIITLNIASNYIGAEGAKLLAMNTTITALNIWNNKIGYEGVRALATNSTITSLDITNNNFGIDGALALAANTTIKTLFLGYNDIGDVGATALAENSTIKTLQIKHCNIGVAGAKALAANTTLTSLDLGRNHIGVDGCKALAANKTIKILNVSLNKIDDEGARALALSSSLKNLDASFNRFGNKGAIALANNNSISTLNIMSKSNHFDVDSIIGVLKNNTTLINVKLVCGPLQVTVKTKLRKLLERNRTLPWLTTIMHARILAQAQRSENCLLGKIPTEILGLINDYAVGANHFSFFVAQFDKRPTVNDLLSAKQMVQT